MPPKAKFTREEIVTAALDLTRTQGPDAVTARALGNKLGASARPIFSVFEGMEEVQKAVLAAAKTLYGQYVQEGLAQTEVPAFQGVGIQYIRFARTEPKLFQMLFMSEQPKPPTMQTILPMIDDNYPQILASVQDCYQFDTQHTEQFYRHLWLYTHGIAVLCATNMCSFTDEDIHHLLTEVGAAMIQKYKGELKHD